MVNVRHVEDICQLLEDSLKSPRTNYLFSNIILDILVPWKLLQRLFYCFSCSLIG